MNLHIVSGIFWFWAGFIASISFLEAWLKFRAPGVTLPIGLGIGKLVFRAKNITEWVFLLVALLIIFSGEHEFFKHSLIMGLIIVISLLLQTFWFLPVLNRRADQFILGDTPAKSTMHIYYGSFELLKAVVLVLYGFKLLNL